MTQRIQNAQRQVNNSQHASPFISIVVVLGFFLLFFCMYGVWSVDLTTPQAAKETLVPKKNQLVAHTPWPMILFEPVAYGTMPTGLPVLSAFKFTSSQNESDFLAHNAFFEERFRHLVSQNVARDVANELDAALRSHEIEVKMCADDSVFVAFVFENDQSIMRVNARRIAEIDDPIGVLLAMSAIEHEFMHYKQWLHALNLADKETFSSSAATEFSQSSCKFLWRNEREAFFSQCSRLNAEGITWVTSDDPKEDFCARTNSSRAFDQAFYYSFMANAKPIEQKTCDDIWWKLAGGPDS